jgi:hypothetical protein
MVLLLFVHVLVWLLRFLALGGYIGVEYSSEEGVTVHGRNDGRRRHGFDYANSVYRCENRIKS